MRIEATTSDPYAHLTEEVQMMRELLGGLEVEAAHGNTLLLGEGNIRLARGRLGVRVVDHYTLARMHGLCNKQ